MRLIAYSLFGDGPKYNAGMVANSLLAPVIYPGWCVRVYHDDRITVADRLLREGCELVPMKHEPGGKAMCWRFLPASDKSIERVIVRDADSRLNPREAAAVNAWIASGKAFQTMCDHDHHRCFPVFGGMWGCKGGALPLMDRWIIKRRRWHDRLDDMELLRDQAWPRMSGDCCRHSSVDNPWGGEPFPLHEPYSGFVGQQHEADGRGINP